MVRWRYLKLNFVQNICVKTNYFLDNLGKLCTLEKLLKPSTIFLIVVLQWKSAC